MAVTCHFIDQIFKTSTILLDCFVFHVRHTADNLAQELTGVAAEWGISDKVVVCVSDNAANVKAAIRIVGWMHLPCFAHTINLVVRESLKAVQPVVDKVKNMVEYFHRSPVATEHLRATQQQMGLQELRLDQDVVTRWNSTYYMLNRFVQQKDAIIALINLSLLTLSLEEWEMLMEACEALKPFEDVTVEISDERYVNIQNIFYYLQIYTYARFQHLSLLLHIHNSVF